MSDDDVGYGKPPKHSRFKPGNNANPKGRPKREPSAIAEIIDNVLSALAEYHVRGRIKRARRRELTIKTHVKLALGGDLKSIETLLMLPVRWQRGVRAETAAEHEANISPGGKEDLYLPLRETQES